MKPRAAGKPEQNEFPFEPSAGDAAVRTVDLHCVRLPKPAAPSGSSEIYCMVAAAISVVWHWDRLGYVPLLALSARSPFFPPLSTRTKLLSCIGALIGVDGNRGVADSRRSAPSGKT